MDGPQELAESLSDLLKAKFAAPPDRDDEDAIAHLSYTSGTSGRPKGAYLAHEPTMRATRRIAERLRLSPEDACFGPTTLSNSYQTARTHLQAKLPRYDLSPLTIKIVSEFPMIPTGKISKAQLADRLSAPDV